MTNFLGGAFALQQTEIAIGVLVVLALAAVLLVPFLIKEIRDGKGELGPLLIFAPRGVTRGPMTPTGAGDNTVGTPDDPAPGQPDGQGDPYDRHALRHAPPIQS